MTMIEIGRVHEIVLYPVKSMAGTGVESAVVGWHGIAGDRRFAFRRMGEVNGFPWLSASRLPELLSYNPVGLDESSGEPLPTHVRTPAGSRVELGSAELNTQLSERFGSRVELMNLKHGIFDEAAVSVINLATIAGIGREAGLNLDRRRFRANIVVETERTEPFLEDGWVGGRLIFGNAGPRAVVRRSSLCDDQSRPRDVRERCARHEDGGASQRELRRCVRDSGPNRHDPGRRSSELRGLVA